MQLRQDPLFADHFAIGLPAHLARLVTRQLIWWEAVASLRDLIPKEANRDERASRFQQLVPSAR
jgi:hypothetical protein